MCVGVSDRFAAPCVDVESLSYDKFGASNCSFGKVVEVKSFVYENFGVSKFCLGKTWDARVLVMKSLGFLLKSFGSQEFEL